MTDDELRGRWRGLEMALEHWACPVCGKRLKCPDGHGLGPSVASQRNMHAALLVGDLEKDGTGATKAVERVSAIVGVSVSGIWRGRREWKAVMTTLQDCPD